MALNLAGKTAIVTGAGSGINLSFAAALLSKGCNVLLADLALRPEAHELVSAHSSPSRSPARAVFQETNVREWPQLERIFHIATKEFGKADIVCPGAGVYEPPFSSFWHPPGTASSRDLSSSNRFASLDINLTHPIRTSQLALLHFLSHPSPASPQNTKAIIHISSIAGQRSPLAAPIYNATKHGVNGLVRTLGPLDERIGVRVTAVAPGVIKTPLWTDNPEKLRLVEEGKDEWVTPEYVADTMVNLIEEEEIKVSTQTGDARGRTRLAKVEGGMIIEVAKGKRRVVEQYNDPGPSGEGNTVSGMGKAEDDIWSMLKAGWGDQ